MVITKTASHSASHQILSSRSKHFYTLEKFSCQFNIAHMYGQNGSLVDLLTSTRKKSETAIARELGADEVGADLTAEDKIKTVAELEKRYRAAAMVGDGINDASALARVTVGIAMGVAGTDATIEAADVELMAADLLKVAYCLSLGRKARRISRQNIAFSMLIPAVDIVLAYNPQAAEINTSRLT